MNDTAHMATSQALTSLETHLVQFGASITTEVIEDPRPVPLGGHTYENMGPICNDTMIDLDRRRQTAERVAEEHA